MKGYFQRLIARSTGTGSEVRPLSRQPYAIAPMEKSLTGSDELLTDITRFGERAQAPTRAEQSNASAAEVTETADIPTLTLHPRASAVVDTRMMSGTPTARDSIEMPLRHPAPALGRSQVMDGDEESMTRGAHIGHSAETAQPLDPGAPLQSTRQEILLPGEELRLMPLQPRSGARDAAPSTTIRPFSLASSPVRSPGYADRSSAEQRNNKHAEHESPTVQVTIGRVEIRATVASPPARKTPPRSPAMSLDEYLKQRNGSRR